MDARNHPDVEFCILPYIPRTIYLSLEFNANKKKKTLNEFDADLLTVFDD